MCTCPMFCIDLGVQILYTCMLSVESWYPCPEADDIVSKCVHADMGDMPTLTS